MKDQRLEQDINLLGSWVARQADFIHTDMVIGTCQRPLQFPPVSIFLCIATLFPPASHLCTVPLEQSIYNWARGTPETEHAAPVSLHA